ncbi:MAG: hypothetical protein V4642_07950, partial [Bacteroidota bacterium]
IVNPVLKIRKLLQSTIQEVSEKPNITEFKTLNTELLFASIQSKNYSVKKSDYTFSEKQKHNISVKHKNRMGSITDAIFVRPVNLPGNNHKNKLFIIEDLLSKEINISQLISR